MAAETEGIALLSMYGDEEEEEESAVVVEDEEGAAVMLAEDVGNEEGDENLEYNYMKNDYPPQSFLYKSPQPLISPSPLRSLDDSDSKALIGSPFLQQNLMPLPPVSRSQLSSPFSLSSPSPPAPVAPPSLPEHPDGQRPRIKSLAIVDYAQDEAAMSPDAEAMEIGNNGRVVFGTEVHISDGLQKAEGTTPVPSPNTQQQEFFLPFDAHEQLKSEATISMEFSGKELEVAEVITSSVVSTDKQIDTLLQSFLPPVVATKCSVELQEKINKFLAYKRAGKSFNADLRNRKDYRNPNFLQHAVSYQDIDEIGTCFSKEVFDPHGYNKSDYYDEIEADMKRELERKEQERKKNQKIDFVSGGSQPGGASSALKMNAPSPGVSTLPNCSLPPNSTSCDATRDNRTNKKSKWDKVDGDTKMPSGGHDNPPSVSIHAAHLSAANAGSGYSAFAQLKRREAEEKKSGERKFDKRS